MFSLQELDEEYAEKLLLVLNFCKSNFREAGRNKNPMHVPVIKERRVVCGSKEVCERMMDCQANLIIDLYFSLHVRCVKE